jgi:hypothetical protein
VFLPASGSVVVGVLADTGGRVAGYGVVVALFGASLAFITGNTVVGRDTA